MRNATLVAKPLVTPSSTHAATGHPCCRSSDIRPVALYDGQARASFAGWWGLYTPDVVVAHHHRRKAKDADALTRTYLIGGGAYMAKFLLNSETRSTYLRIGLREWYWTFRRDFLRKGHGLSYLWWEAYGAVAYLAYRIRKRTFSDRSA